MNFRTAGHAIVGCLLPSFPPFFFVVLLCLRDFVRSFSRSSVLLEMFSSPKEEKDTKSLKVSGEMFFFVSATPPPVPPPERDVAPHSN